MWKTSNIIEGTVLLILVYLVVKNAYGFSRVVKAFSDAYIGGVVALQGRSS